MMPHLASADSNKRQSDRRCAESHAEFEDFYVTDDNTVLAIIGLFVLTIGALALL